MNWDFTNAETKPGYISLTEHTKKQKVPTSNYCTYIS